MMAGGLTSSQDSGRFKFYLHIAGASQGQSVFSSWLELSENKNQILSPTPAGSRTLAERVVRSSQAGTGHSRRQHRGQSSLLGGPPAGRCSPWRAGGPVSPTSPPAPVRAHWYFVISGKKHYTCAGEKRRLVTTWRVQICIELKRCFFCLQLYLLH